MTDVPLGEARYRKPSPAHWDELHALANESIDAGHSPESVVHETWKRLSELDHETVDRIRYRGLGSVTCSVIRPLADEAVQNEFVRDAAEAMVDGHPRYCKNPWVGEERVSKTRGLYIGELVSLPSEVLGEQPVVRASYDALPAGTKLLTDTAIVAATFGIRERLTNFKDYHMRRVLSSDLAFESVIANFTAGASMVLAAELGRRYTQKNGPFGLPGEPRFWPYDQMCLVKQAVSCKELRNIDNLDRVAKIASGIRLDEIRMSHLYKLISDDPQGIFIDPKHIPRQPAPINRAHEPLSRLPHEARLQCPARPVDGAIALATKLAVRIVAETQHQLLGHTHQVLEKLRLVR